MASFWLEYTQDGERREFSFDTGTVSIGRDKAADFVLDHPTVSRQHALIRAESRGHHLVVLSKGGLTALDGGQVQGEVPLYDGSEIHFGQLSFTFRSTSAPPKPAGQSHGGGAGFGGSVRSTGTDGGLGGATGSAPGTNNGAFSADSGSNSWDTGGAGWDAGWDQAPEAAAEPAAPEPADGIVSWDQIANSAEAQDDYQQDKLTDFQRIQAAQAKADKQTKGNNPWIIYGGVIGIVALIVATMWPQSKAPVGTDEILSPEAERPFISWEKSDIDCIGKANCMASAISAYKVGKNLAEQAGADITNPYEAYKQFDRAQKLLEAGQITTVPPEMANVTDLQAKVKDGLDTKFNQARINYLNFEKRKMYKQMAGELNKVIAYFPDKRCLYNQWAVGKEREMKDARVYPVTNLAY